MPFPFPQSGFEPVHKSQCNRHNAMDGHPNISYLELVYINKTPHQWLCLNTVVAILADILSVSPPWVTPSPIALSV